MPQILSNKSSLAYAYFANKWPLSLQLYQKTWLQLTNVKSQEQKQFWVKIWSSGSGVGERRLSGKLSTQLSESTRTLFWLDHNNRKLFGCIDECFGVSTFSVWLLEILVGFSQFLSFIWSLTQPGDGMVSCISSQFLVDVWSWPIVRLSLTKIQIQKMLTWELSTSLKLLLFPDCLYKAYTYLK